MKIHYIVKIYNHHREIGGPACDSYSALVVLGKDGTRHHKKVTCGNCKRTKAFRKIK